MGFRIYQTRPLDAQSEITLTVGQTWYDPDVRMKLVRTRSNELLAAFFDVGAQLQLTNHGSYVNYRITIPTMYQGRTQGFLGNFDGNSRNEFHDRESLDPLPITITSNRQSPAEHQTVLNHFNTHCKFITHIN